jgi:hypothetical protein
MEAGLSEVAVGSTLWVEYRAPAGATMLPGVGVTGLGADMCHDPTHAGAGSGVWMPWDVIGRAVGDGWRWW